MTEKFITGRDVQSMGQRTVMWGRGGSVQAAGAKPSCVIRGGTVHTDEERW